MLLLLLLLLSPSSSSLLLNAYLVWDSSVAQMSHMIKKKLFNQLKHIRMHKILHQFHPQVHRVSNFSSALKLLVTVIFSYSKPIPMFAELPQVGKWSNFQGLGKVRKFYFELGKIAILKKNQRKLK